MKILVFLALFGFLSMTFALYNECGTGRSFGNLDQMINVSGCRKTYCRLKKKHSTLVQFRFTPSKDTNKLTNQISATIAGIPFPFIGVDGTDAIPSIYELGGEKKASLPLKAGTTYMYKKSINVLELYPSIKLVVRWALHGRDGDVMCFEVPARIIN